MSDTYTVIRYNGGGVFEVIDSDLTYDMAVITRNIAMRDYLDWNLAIAIDRENKPISVHAALEQIRTILANLEEDYGRHNL